MKYKGFGLIVDRRHSSRSTTRFWNFEEKNTVSRMITKLIGMVDSVTSPLQAPTGTDALVEDNREKPRQENSMENESMTEMAPGEHEEMVDTIDSMPSDSVHPAMELSADDNQADPVSGGEQPSISALVAAADGFNAAFNVALYELDVSRKQLVEHSARIDALNESIKTLNSALSDEVCKGQRKEEEYSLEKELMHQRIHDIESIRDQLQLQINEQESTLNARAAEISQLSSRVEELTGSLDQRTAEGQRAAEEISHLTTRIEELTGTLDQRTAEGQRAEEEIGHLTARFEELTGTLDQRTAEGQRAEEEISHLTTRIEELNGTLDQRTVEGQRAEEEIGHLTARIEELSGTLDQRTAEGQRAEEEISHLTTRIEELNGTLDQRTAEGQRAEEEISHLTARIEELSGTLDQRTVEGQRAEEEISHLTARIEELSGTLDQRTAEAQQTQEELVRETNELTSNLDDLKARLDDADAQLKTQRKELEDRDEEITGLCRQAESLIADLDSVIEESDQQENTYHQETTRFCKEIEELKESLQSKEMLLEQRSNELDSKIKEASWQNENINELKNELDTQSETIRAQSESHASACEELNAQICSISGKQESLHAAYGELEVHSEKLENLNRALHESSMSENSLHKKVLEDKASEIELLRTKLEAANESLQGDPEKTTAIDNLQLALDNLGTRVKEAEAERDIYSERAKVAATLESEVDQLRSALLEAGDAASSQSSVDADALQSLQSLVTDLQSALANSESKQKALGDQLIGHEELEQEVIRLRETVQQADSCKIEQSDDSTALDALKEEAAELRSALSASEEKCAQLQSAQSSAPPPDSSFTEGMSLVPQGSQPVAEATDRNRFLSHLNNLLAVPGNAEMKQTVMFILLDNFIQVREEIGIMNSEQVINGISEIITSHCNTDDMMSRFGDCTFAVLSSNESTEVTQQKAETIRSTVEDHIFESAGQSLITTLSIGICSVRKNDTSAEGIMSRADLACEAVRSSGGNGVLVSSALADDMIAQGTNEGHKEVVSRTLSENRIDIYYQPISSLKDVAGSYFEVLTRVVDEEGNIILPGEFFAMAASSGQTVEIDRYIIENIMKMMAENPGQDMTLFIKLTRQSVADHELPIWIIRKIKEYRINPEQLVFELAESTLQSDIKNVSALTKALNSIGCKIAIEHYRMSTHTQHLQHIHADYLKIDSGLVESMGRKGDSLAKVTAIMDMARKNNYLTVAEGVESPASLAILWELGVNFAQGYFIQAPSGNRDYDFHDSMSDEESEDSTRATFRIE